VAHRAGALARRVARGAALSHHRPRDHRRIPRHRRALGGAARARHRRLLDPVPGRVRCRVPGGGPLGVRAAGGGARRMRKLFWISALVAMAGMVVAPFLILAAPLEREMGLVQKIFYFHVPCASVTFLTVYVCGLASVAYLVRRSPLADAVAVASAELAVLF